MDAGTHAWEKESNLLTGFTITQDDGRAALILMTMQNPLNQPLDQYSSIPSCQYIKRKKNFFQKW